jgi:hypothetical protein
LNTLGLDKPHQYQDYIYQLQMPQLEPHWGISNYAISIGIDALKNPP